MILSSRRRNHSPVEIWPGFVDSLATILMVIIFVLMTFVVAQLFLTDALHNKDRSLNELSEKNKKLKNILDNEKKKNQEHQQQNADLEKLLKNLEIQIASLKGELSHEQTNKEKTLEKSQSLADQIQKLLKQIDELQSTLETNENDRKEKEENIKNFKIQLDNLSLEKDALLKKDNEEIENLKKENFKLFTENKKYKGKNRLTHYRSEFFAKLKKIIGDRSDIRVVGDRFIFQSEVLFDVGSAELGKEGKKKLDQLVNALKEISHNIPENLKWVLRVDGHTDKLPIKNAQFKSNWDLSSARSISVVQYLIEKGIESSHLVAAGFGEHQPLTNGENEKDLARNRRIEFKLDQR